MSLVRLPVSLFVVTAFALAPTPFAAAQPERSSVYAVNQAASTIGFTIYGSMIFKIKRDGLFKSFSGQLSYDPTNPAAAHVDLTVFTNSVDMHDAGNNALMKSPDFFDVARFPTMHFASSLINVKPDGSLDMTGDMTIRGITRHMTIPVSLKPAQTDSPGAVFESTFPIDRMDFGLNGSPRLGGFRLSISRNVQIHIAIATSLDRPPFLR